MREDDFFGYEVAAIGNVQEIDVTWHPAQIQFEGKRLHTFLTQHLYAHGIKNGDGRIAGNKIL